MAEGGGVPRTPSRLVTRRRLLDRLSAGVDWPVTLVAASAGMGKTVLLASWIAEHELPGPVAWLTLGTADNEPEQFWAHLVAAVRQSAVPASVTEAVEPAMVRADPSLAGALAALVDRLRTPVVLVLDDFHTITDVDVLAGIQAMLRLGNSMLRLMIATRVDPTLPYLSRLRLHDDLIEVRDDDLAFTVAESAELLNEHGVRLTDASLALLQGRTQGWAAGLRLAALWLQSRPDTNASVADFAGTDRTIADYLVAEVLDTMPADMRNFLLCTCVVHEVNGELADVLTGRVDGHQNLVLLERAHAFVSAVDADRRWYRYHPLFADLLRFELLRRLPDQVPELHRRAARWYAEHGAATPAIRHAVDARDWDLSVALLTRHGLTLAVRDDIRRIRPLTERLPAEVLARSPELDVLAAVDRFEQVDHDALRQRIAVARRQLNQVPESRREQFALVLAVLELLAARHAGDIERVQAIGKQVLQLQFGPAGVNGGETEDNAVRSMALLNVGTAEHWLGDLDAAEDHLREGTALAQRLGLAALHLEGLSHLAQAHVARGRLTSAMRVGLQATDLAAASGWLASHRTTGAHVALAAVCLERNELDSAARHVDAARTACVHAKWRPLVLGLAVVHAWLRQARDDPAGGQAVLDAARQEVADAAAPVWIQQWLTLTDAELHTATGERETARRLLDSLEGGHPQPHGPSSGPHAVAVARLRLADGDPTAARRALAPWLDGAALLASPRWLIAAWMLHAVATDQLDDRSRSARSLERALALAEPEGFRQVFIDGGPPVRRLLSEHLDDATPYRSFVGALLGQRAASRTATAPGLLEALTDRQRDVLRYLPSRLSAAEIARELYLSVHTVKSHMRQIYRKLGVARRREAVELARELELL